MRAQRWEHTSVHLEVGGWMNPTVDREAIDAEPNRYGVALFKRPRGG